RDEALGGVGVEERLVAGGIDSVNRDPGGARALHPYRGVARVRGIAVDAQGDQAIPLGGIGIEKALVLRGADAVIGLEIHGYLHGSRIDRETGSPIRGRGATCPL